MQRAAQCVVTTAFVLLFILGSQTMSGGIAFLIAGEKAKSPPVEPKKNEPVTPSKLITNTISMKLGYIPPRTFTMGSPLSEQEQYKKDNTDESGVFSLNRAAGGSPMPRRLRFASGGYVYHVLNRAVGRVTLFRKEGDYAAFEKTLRQAPHFQPMRLLEKGV
jgi:hypothetical protein